MVQELGLTGMGFKTAGSSNPNLTTRTEPLSLTVRSREAQALLRGVG